MVPFFDPPCERGFTPRYILTNLDTGAILGQKLDGRGDRPFVSIAEAYETLARMEALEGAKPEEIGRSFNGWTLHEVRPVEDR